jgi:RND family efflux transporter MFP subunit
MKGTIVLIALVAAAVWGALQWRRSVTDPAAAAEAGRPKEAQVELRDIRFAVNAAGEIGPAEQVSVRPEINGRIDSLPVDLGDRVRRGSVLFTLEDKELQNQRSSSVTEIERAKLQLQQAERNYLRARQLFNQQLVSQELFENAKTEFELGKNSLERAQKELLLIEERLTKTKIVAPFDCTVLTRPVSMGQAVSGSGGFNSGTEVLTIADLNNMVINAHINQADITRLRVNQEVEVAIEAVAGLSVVGSVERIAPQATIKNNIKGFAVRILLTDVDQRVRPGMTANIKIPVASADQVLAVPLAAVFTEKDPDTGRYERFVFVKQGERFLKRLVQVGVSDFFHAEIPSGLAGGEVVALEQPKDARLAEAREKQPAGSPAPAGGGGGAVRQTGASNPPAATAGSVPAAAPAPAIPIPPAARPSTPRSRSAGVLVPRL